MESDSGRPRSMSQSAAIGPANEHVALDAIAQAPSVLEALQAFQRRYGVSFVTYHLSRTAAGKVDAPFVRTTYPDAWVARYLLRGYVDVDPVVREGFARRLPFDWRELQVDLSVEDFLRDAIENGIGAYGYSIPITDKEKRHGLLSVNSALPSAPWEALVSQYRAEWIGLAQLVHRIAVRELYGDDDPVPSLSPRELECLHWTALGKDHKDIALLLNLSEHTVRDYLKSARLKLGCATRSAAATRAIHLGIITPWKRQLPRRGG